MTLNFVNNIIEGLKGNLIFSQQDKDSFVTFTYYSKPLRYDIA
jgi:hypothetical protein